MPTRLRVDLAGSHHVVNRGVNRCNIFESNFDKEMFLQIMNKTASIHRVVLHDYCLMDNHYHLLIETEKENLSTFMRIINANYAKYFNKKYQRSGHLWQDRYKSKFVTSEEYLYVLIRYIEYNPVDAGMTEKVGEYPFTFTHRIFNNLEFYPCQENSILLRQFKIEMLNDFFDAPISETEVAYLREQEKQKIEKSEEGISVRRSKKFEEHFYDVSTRLDRNLAIINAYLDGYTQVDIANYLNLSKPLISKVIKSGDSLTGV